MNRFRYSLVIRSYDRKLDRNIKSKNELHDKGFINFDLNEFFEDKEFCSELKNSKLRRAINKEGLILDWKLPEFFWNRILTSEKLIKLVTSYLGKDARLDDAYLKTIGDTVNSVSEGWHDDNVGYRLKLFIVFDVEGNPAPTILVPNSRPFLYSVKIIDEIKRVIFRNLNKEYLDSSITVNYKPGSCLLFDTNLKHRGGYSQSSGVRHCLIVEYIDRHKADAIKSFSPCGPRQGRGTIEIPINHDLLKNNVLIDKNILQEKDKKFLYG